MGMAVLILEKWNPRQKALRQPRHPPELTMDKAETKDDVAQQNLHAPCLSLQGFEAKYIHNKRKIYRNSFCLRNFSKSKCTIIKNE